MAKKSFKDMLAPLEMPRKNAVRNWIESKENDYEKWLNKSEKAKTEEESSLLKAWAYVTDDGFYYYCRDVLGFKDMHEPFHKRMCRFIVGKGVPYYFNKRARYLQAFRGSFKSSILSVGYSTWLLAREYKLSEEPRKLRSRIQEIAQSIDLEEFSDGVSRRETLQKERSDLDKEISALVKSGKHLDGVNIRIGLASESLDLPSDHVATCCTVMDSEEYIKYFGDHAPRDRGKGAKWGRSGLTSVFRTNKALRDPTIWTISLEAPRTGRHFDVIIPDDLQGEKKSGSRLQLRETWKLYNLLFPLLDPPNISNYSELVGAATRWHEQDIYGKMEQENENKAKCDCTEILKMPVCNEAEIATCPTIYKTKDIPSLKARSIHDFPTQYLLKPRGSKTTAFKREWLRHYDPNSDGYRNMPGLEKSYVTMGVDFCWIEAARRNDETADHSVIQAWRVFPGNRWYLVGMSREQETRMETLVRAHEMYKSLKADSIGLSMSDRRHVEADIDRYEFEHRFVMNKVWVSDLSSYATGDDTNKNRKIIGTLQRLFADGKVYIPMGITWFEEEILDCPMGITDDGMDAMVCAVEASRPPLPDEREIVKEEDNIWFKHTQALLKGRPIYLNGKPMHGNRSGMRGHRSTRRARNWR